MNAVQVVSSLVAAVVTVAAVALAARTVARMVRIIRLGRTDSARLDQPLARTRTMLREIFGHTRMLKWTLVGAAHWFVMIAFITLTTLVLEAYFEVVEPTAELPLVGGWLLYGLLTEWIGILGLLGIATLIVVRLANLPRRHGRASRFFGSTMWQGYFVEYVIIGVLICGFLIRGFKVATGHFEHPAWATPVSHLLGGVLPADLDAVSVVAAVKIVISMAWLIVIALHSTMGVAWHRFTAFPNIYFKRNATGEQALGALKPITVDGKPIDFEEADPEKDPFGVGQVEQFTWKGLLDFTTCTECGRCQSQCPAWHTGKPLSPKLVILNLRDHAYAKAPYLLAGGRKDATGEETATEEQLAGVPAAALAEAERPLVGAAGDAAGTRTIGTAGGVIDPDVLWSCTTCGACVEQCPVDIEHVDHIVDMRRHQVMIESDFPSEAGVMLRNLENKGNPWGANQRDREDWTKGLDFDVPRASGPDDDFEYLFWVGCAGAFDDKAKKTTRAVATLLHEAGVRFAILGEGETCTGDPARRVGNEFLFQMMAQQTTETLNEVFGDRPAKKIVATCPHCFNTLANEYGQLGGHFDVVHHTQLLATLVAEGQLTPVKQVEDRVTYHDPCYLGRHNRVFAPPREVLGAVTGDGASGDGGAPADSAARGLVEMPRFAERSFCCGAGGARMWMEERIGQRINVNRVEEALATGAKTVAVSCPFCMTMLGDGVTGKQSNGEAAEDVEVVDVATVLLRSVRPDGAAPADGSPASGDPAGSGSSAGSESAADESAEPGDPVRTDGSAGSGR